MKRSLRSQRNDATVETTAISTNAESNATDGASMASKRKRKNKPKAENPTVPSNHNATIPTPSFRTLDLECQPMARGGGRRLSSSFYNQGTVNMANDILGKVLCRKLPETGQILRGTIVEAEAYPGEGDRASQTFKGVQTPSNAALFMDPGTAYVYMTYGMYHCINISTNDVGGGCLLRAAEVLEDYEIMQTFRQPKSKKKQSKDNDKPVKRLKQHELANGPSKLCLAFGIDRSCNKIDMITSEDLWLEESLDPKYREREFEVETSWRVGIDSVPGEARTQPYRFFVDENLSVSKVKFKNGPKSKSQK